MFSRARRCSSRAPLSQPAAAGRVAEHEREAEQVNRFERHETRMIARRVSPDDSGRLAL